MAEVAPFSNGLAKIVGGTPSARSVGTPCYETENEACLALYLGWPSLAQFPKKRCGVKFFKNMRVSQVKVCHSINCIRKIVITYAEQSKDVLIPGK